MGSSVAKYEAVRERGGDVPWANPDLLRIVGDDDDVPATDANWYAQCPRATEDPGDDLVADIETHGVIHPISVYGDGTRLIVLDGRRRVHAARKVRAKQTAAGLPEEDRILLRAIIRKGSPEELYQFNIGADRTGGEPKPKNPLQRAQQMLLHWKRTGESHAKTGQAFSCGAQVVRYMLKVFDLAPELQERIACGDLSLREAIGLADFERAEQPKKLAQLEAVGATKGTALREGVKKLRRGEAPSKPAPRGQRTGAGAIKAQCRAVAEAISLRIADRRRSMSAVDQAICTAGAAVARFLGGEKKALDYHPDLRDAVLRGVEAAKAATPAPAKAAKSAKPTGDAPTE